MAETPVSLLDRLIHRPDDDAWRQLVDLYTPYIRSWFQRDPALRQDVDDLVQEVLRAVVRDLPKFRREGPGRFRAWLRGISVHRLKAHWKACRTRPPAVGGSGADFLDHLENPASDLSRQWDREHDQYVANRLLEQIEPEFAGTTMQAFRAVALGGRKAVEVAAELGMTVAAVLKAKSRVLARLRERGKGLLD